MAVSGCKGLLSKCRWLAVVLSVTAGAAVGDCRCLTVAVGLLSVAVGGRGRLAVSAGCAVGGCRQGVRFRRKRTRRQYRKGSFRRKHEARVRIQRPASAYRPVFPGEVA